MPLLLLPAPFGEALLPKSVPSSGLVTGPRNFGTAQPAIIPAPVPSAAEVVGPEAPLDPATARPITPAPIESWAQVPGAWLPEVADPLEPVIPAGPASVSRRMKVVVDSTGAELEVTAAQAKPEVNGVGSGSYTLADHTASPPALRTLVGFSIAGRRTFTGRVSGTSLPEVASGEESAQLAQVTVEGLLGEWAEAVVLPDFGAQDLDRLGPPTQDTRIFDWTMNGLGVDSPDGIPKPNIIDSIGANPRFGEAGELFPLPDVWPDPYAKVMWATDPGDHAKRGWCHFREPFGIPGSRRIQIWLAAREYCEAWLDGVPILTVDKPGVAQRIELEVRDDFHLLTLRAYCSGGPAGVLCSIVPVASSGLYEEPLRRSGGGWKALAYPTRSFRLNPAQVLTRLRLEARRRRVANIKDWVWDGFNASHDSAGRPWPANDPIAVQVGSTYLDVLNQLATGLVDYVAAPAGRRLRLYVKDEGTGAAVSSPWTEGTNLMARTRTEALR